MTDTVAAEAVSRELSEHILAAPQGTLPGLIERMEAVERVLSAVGLVSVLPFAASYRDLTDRARQAADEGQFADPVTTERVACTFAIWYFRALRDHVSGDHAAVPEPWQQLFSHESTHQPAWLQLAFGLNSHIGHDLPLALHQTAVQPGYRTDFFSVNPIIRGSAPELAPSYLGGAGHMVRRHVTTTSTRVIISWRERAWQNFMRLREGSLPPPQLEHDTARRGERLRHLRRPLAILGLRQFELSGRF